MPWPLGVRKTLLLAAFIALGMGYTPMSLSNGLAYLLYHAPSMLFTTLSIPPPPPHTLKAAILNVTRDFDQLSALVQEFLRSPGVDPAVEKQFRHFLADRAVRSHPHLESSLDWLLALYKFAFPFLLISMIAKLSGSAANQTPETEAPLRPSSEHILAEQQRHYSAPAQRHKPATAAAANRRWPLTEMNREGMPSSPGTPDVGSLPFVSTTSKFGSGVQTK